MTSQPPMGALGNNNVIDPSLVGISSLADIAPNDPRVLAVLNKSEEGRSLIGWADGQYTKLKSAREPFERQWRLNYAFYMGRQYVEYRNLGVQVGGRLIEPKVPPYRVRSIRNRIKPIIRTELSKLTSTKPTASVVPASTDDKDLYAAQAGEQVWETVYAQHKIHRVFRRAMFWNCICGNSFIKDWWDAECLDYSKQYIGDLKYGAVTPFHVLVPDLFEEELEDQPYMINIYTKPVEWVSKFYPEVGNAHADVVNASEIMGDSMFRTLDSNAKPDSVLVKEVWVKPNGHKLFPEGGMFTVACGKLVAFYDGMYFEHGEYPFTKFSHIPSGMFYANSVIDDLINPQRDYNRTSSQVIESKNRMAMPQLIAPVGTVNPSMITSQPGQVILYKPGFGPPAPLPLQPLPSYVLQEFERAVSDMEDISSQHQVSHGEAPPGVTAATAISFLQERDDTSMSPTYQDVEVGYEKLAKHTLSNVVQFWDTPRIVGSTGTDGLFDAITLQGSEIASGTDVRMEAGSALPTSKAAKQAFLLDLMGKGFIDPDKGLSMMDMGGVEKLYDEVKADERQAGRENLRMRSLDVDAIMQHMKEHEESVFAAQQQQQMLAQQQEQGAVQNVLPGLPPEVGDPNNAMQALQGLDQLSQSMSEPPVNEMGQPAPEQMAEPQPVPADAGFGQDTQTQQPLVIPPNMVSVNTWDNHQVHIDIHNRFRKNQIFEILPDAVKQQFEAHVSAHAMALNQSAIAAAMMMPPDQQPPGATNGSGSAIGTNQFGPPGTTQGGEMPPPPNGG